jgi:hypothetical protein
MLFGRAKARKRLLEGEPLSDAEFLQQLKIGDADDAELAVAIRKVIADCCNVEREYIHPSTEIPFLQRAMRSGFIQGWDHLDFVFRLEIEFNAGIATFAGNYEELYTSAFHGPFGDWLLEAIPIIKVRLHRKRLGRKNEDKPT